MKRWVFIGGSGIRTAWVLGSLNVMGLIDPPDKVLIIDAEGSAGYKSEVASAASAMLGFGTKGAKVEHIAPLPPNKDTIKDLFTNLTPDSLFHHFFTEDSANYSLQEGFYAKPRLAHVVLEQELSGRTSRYLEKENTVDTVYIVGSVAGGTGAGLIPGVARIYKEKYPDAKVIGIVFPRYFKAPENSRTVTNEKLKANSILGIRHILQDGHEVFDAVTFLSPHPADINELPVAGSNIGAGEGRDVVPHVFPGFLLASALIANGTIETQLQNMDKVDVKKPEQKVMKVKDGGTDHVMKVYTALGSKEYPHLKAKDINFSFKKAHVGVDHFDDVLPEVKKTLGKLRKNNYSALLSMSLFPVAYLNKAYKSFVNIVTDNKAVKAELRDFLGDEGEFKTTIDRATEFITNFKQWLDFLRKDGKFAFVEGQDQKIAMPRWQSAIGTGTNRTNLAQEWVRQIIQKHFVPETSINPGKADSVYFEFLDVQGGNLGKAGNIYEISDTTNIATGALPKNVDDLTIPSLLGPADFQRMLLNDGNNDMSGRVLTLWRAIALGFIKLTPWDLERTMDDFHSLVSKAIEKRTGSKVIHLLEFAPGDYPLARRMKTHVNDNMSFDFNQETFIGWFDIHAGPVESKTEIAGSVIDNLKTFFMENTEALGLADRILKRWLYEITQIPNIGIRDKTWTKPLIMAGLLSNNEPTLEIINDIATTGPVYLEGIPGNLIYLFSYAPQRVWYLATTIQSLGQADPYQAKDRWKGQGIKFKASGYSHQAGLFRRMGAYIVEYSDSFSIDPNLRGLPAHIRRPQGWNTNTTSVSAPDPNYPDIFWDRSTPTDIPLDTGNRIPIGSPGDTNKVVTLKKYLIDRNFNNPPDINGVFWHPPSSNPQSGKWVIFVSGILQQGNTTGINWQRDNKILEVRTTTQTLEFDFSHVEVKEVDLDRIWSTHLPIWVSSKEYMDNNTGPEQTTTTQDRLQVTCTYPSAPVSKDYFGLFKPLPPGSVVISVPREILKDNESGLKETILRQFPAGTINVHAELLDGTRVVKSFDRDKVVPITEFYVEVWPDLDPNIWQYYVVSAYSDEPIEFKAGIEAPGGGLDKRIEINGGVRESIAKNMDTRPQWVWIKYDNGDSKASGMFAIDYPDSTNQPDATDQPAVQDVNIGIDFGTYRSTLIVKKGVFSSPRRDLESIGNGVQGCWNLSCQRKVVIGNTPIGSVDNALKTGLFTPQPWVGSNCLPILSDLPPALVVRTTIKTKRGAHLHYPFVDYTFLYHKVSDGVVGFDLFPPLRAAERNDLKWDENSEYTAHRTAFLTTLILVGVVEVLKKYQVGDIRININYAWPLSFSKAAREDLANSFQAAVTDVQSWIRAQNVQINLHGGIAESVAGIVAANSNKRLVVTADLGGGSLDIGIVLNSERSGQGTQTIESIEVTDSAGIGGETLLKNLSGLTGTSGERILELFDGNNMETIMNQNPSLGQEDGPVYKFMSLGLEMVARDLVSILYKIYRQENAPPRDVEIVLLGSGWRLDKIWRQDSHFRREEFKRTFQSWIETRIVDLSSTIDSDFRSAISEKIQAQNWLGLNLALFDSRSEKLALAFGVIQAPNLNLAPPGGIIAPSGLQEEFVSGQISQWHQIPDFPANIPDTRTIMPEPDLPFHSLTPAWRDEEDGIRAALNRQKAGRNRSGTPFGVTISLLANQILGQDRS